MMETRFLSEPIEFRSEGTKLVAAGVAIRYGQPSKVMRDFREIIAPGAADQALTERDVKALHEHDQHKILGRVSAGTLRIENTPTEMRYEIDLPDTTYGRDLAVSLERRDITGSSFGFRALKSAEKWSVDDDGIALRTVGAFEMFDHISTTANPAYDLHTSELAFRSLASDLDVDVNKIVEAARKGELPQLIAPTGDETSGGDDTGRGDPTPVVRRRITGLTL
jgi:HK97 family phage prohead protease